MRRWHDGNRKFLDQVLLEHVDRWGAETRRQGGRAVLISLMCRQSEQGRLLTRAKWARGIVLAALGRAYGLSNLHCLSSAIRREVADSYSAARCPPVSG